ncbi:uncharacterized protein LOC126375775 [Pectinophora gossypiella]|uniref:uncharacterized protein LOC126375775 n=1 Tax=Pectinophora gossypiella TaxID=13191 RepID=UPI00214F5BB8|nr:uncharacterized protein LOC126375775 [Pectinophora gossypiella]
MANKVIADDNNTLKQCQKYARNEATEIYGTDNYKLIIPIKDNDPEYITVTIKHRVVFIYADMPDIDPRFQSDDSIFYDIRILPNFLNTKKARWFAKNGKLEIAIPYKFIFNKEARKTCEADFGVDEQEIKVPKREEKEEIGIDEDIINQIFGKKAVVAPNRMMDDDNDFTTTTTDTTPTTTETTLTTTTATYNPERMIFPD